MDYVRQFYSFSDCHLWPQSQSILIGTNQSPFIYALPCSRKKVPKCVLKDRMQSDQPDYEDLKYDENDEYGDFYQYDYDEEKDNQYYEDYEVEEGKDDQYYEDYNKIEDDEDYSNIDDDQQGKKLKKPCKFKGNLMLHLLREWS